jgi:ATP-dependent helicase Lhr and Lhr-like helicase
MSVFSRLPERLQHAIANELGFSSLRDVQELAGEAILDGKNAVVLAPTAGGKTEAATFPVIGALLQDPPRGVGALYVAPIKALLNNQEVRLGQYTEMVGLRRFVWHGDTQPGDKAGFLRNPADLTMTTPESIEVMLMSPRVPADVLFADLRVAVIDEVHAFAGTDRGAHLMSVLERLAALSKHDVQRVGLSATVGNPEQIARWLGALRGGDDGGPEHVGSEASAAGSVADSGCQGSGR